MTALPFLWSGAASLAGPGLRLWLRRRAARGKEIQLRLQERRGFPGVARPPGTLIWLHAASVGETVSVLPVITSVLDRAPGARVLITTGTVTSARLLENRIAVADAGRVIHRFVPLDVPAWVARFLDHWRPDVAAFVESELWPNMLAGCRARGIPAMLINARISPRSFAHWGRVSGFARHVLSAFEIVQAQGDADADRLRALGALRVTSPGNLKFAAPELPVDQAELDRLRKLLAARPVWLAASTHPGEETIVGAAHARIARAFPALLTIVAPRHPERGAAIAPELKMFGAVSRRADGDAPPESGLWIADTMGELGLFYRLAPIVVMGRSLTRPGGGQNPLEPARFGCAVATGPFTANFLDAAGVLEEAGGLARVTDSITLADWVCAMLRDGDARRAMGEAARAAACRDIDLPDQTAAVLLSLIGKSD